MWFSRLFTCLWNVELNIMKTIPRSSIFACHWKTLEYLLPSYFSWEDLWELQTAPGQWHWELLAKDPNPTDCSCSWRGRSPSPLCSWLHISATFVVPAWVYDGMVSRSTNQSSWRLTQRNYSYLLNSPARLTAQMCTCWCWHKVGGRSRSQTWAGWWGLLFQQF